MSAKQQYIDRSDDGPLYLLKKLINNFRLCNSQNHTHIRRDSKKITDTSFNER